jgi:hypothetical protein
MTPEQPTEPRKPRIALMGEFSAGKSTLANILMREALSPVQITATQLPPLWYTWGDGAPIRIGFDGTETPVEGTDLRGQSIADTRAIRVQVKADILEACDIIDMPGSSDPNMTVDIWNEMLPMADGVIWCTPATQAWRQSEAALWEEVSERLGRYSVLLLTRFDKILSPEDRARVVKRVTRETAGTFRGVHPVSLIAAQAAGTDPEKWKGSGMAAVLDDLLKVVIDLTDEMSRRPAMRRVAAPAPAQAETPKPEAAPQPDSAPQAEAAPKPEASPAAETQAILPRPEAAPTPLRRPHPEMRSPAAEGQIVPRRVAPRTSAGSERPRPRRSEASGSLI